MGKVSFSDGKPEDHRAMDSLSIAAAYRGMEAIELSTKLGAVSLKIKAEARKEKAKEIQEQALQNLVFHKAASKAFKKDSGFERDSAHSDKLETHLKTTIVDVLGVMFENVVVETGAYVKTASKAELEMTAARDAGKKAGLTDDILKVMFPKLYEPAKANGATEAKPAEVVAS